MNLKNLAVIVLAAGKGTRFGESYTKLLHPIFGKPLIYYPLQNLKNLDIENIFVVVSDSKVESEVAKYLNCSFVYMDQPTGTSDAVKVALPKLPPNIETILVLNGDDATLYSQETLFEFINSHESNNSKISMMTMITKRDMQVGRIIRDKNKNFSKILEYKEYLEEDEKSDEINCGVYLIDLEFAKSNIPKVEKSPSGEYYLTDLLNLAQEQESPVNLYILKDHSQWVGINDKKDLKYAESIIKKRNLNNGKLGTGKAVHFLGIAGSGSSACAKLAEAAGFKVSGCDKDFSGEFTKVLEALETFEGHSPTHLEKIDILAVTPAVLSLDPNNPEILEAKKKNIPILTWQEFCGKFLTKNKFVIAICGTHGKSTTTAMIAKILEDAKLDPTVLLGATTSFWNTNFRVGKGKYFVIEADEFNNNFLSLTPDISVLTNVEFDHPEFFSDYEMYQSSFKKFLTKTKHLIIANLSDKNSESILADGDGVKKSISPVVDFSKNLIDFPLKVTGHHNILNASAAFNLSLNLEISPEKIKSSLQSYQGIGRRMELIGEINGASIFSDFAHHPTAIKVATDQIKKQYPLKNIWIIYQPHMFSRTKALFKKFVEVFKNLGVGYVAMLDIYASREKDEGLIKTEDLVNEINLETVSYAKGVKETLGQIRPLLSEKDVVLFMGAGDIDNEIRKELNAI